MTLSLRTERREQQVPVQQVHQLPPIQHVLSRPFPIAMRGFLQLVFLAMSSSTRWWTWNRN